MEHVKELAEVYPSDITKGSLFNAGILHALTPQYNRLAAFQVIHPTFYESIEVLLTRMRVQGDTVFHASRRFLHETLSGKQNQWAYCTSESS